MQSSSCAKQKLRASEVQRSVPGQWGHRALPQANVPHGDWPQVSTARQLLLISGFGDSIPVPSQGL